MKVKVEGEEEEREEEVQKEEECEADDVTAQNVFPSTFSVQSRSLAGFLF